MLPGIAITFGEDSEHTRLVEDYVATLAYVGSGGD